MDVYMAIERGPKLVQTPFWPVGEISKSKKINEDFAHIYTEKYREYVIVYLHMLNQCGVYFMVDMPKYPYDPSKK